MGSKVWCCLASGMSDGKAFGIFDDSGKTHEDNVQDARITYPLNELIKWLPDEKAFWCVARYCVHLKHLEDLHLSLNKNILPDIWDHNTRSPSSATVIEQANCNTYDLTNKLQSSFTGIDQQQHMSKSNLDPAHSSNLHPQKAVASKR